MSYPKTESRLPFNWQVADLGEAARDTANKLALISYYSSPLALSREQTYVLIITDNTLQNSFHSIRWQIRNTDVTNQVPVWKHTHDQTGPTTLTVTVLDNGGAELARVSLNQTVAPLNEALENLIQLDNATHPVADDPVTSREIINDLLPLLHNVANVGTHETKHKLLFGVSYTSALSHPKADRDRLINTLMGHVNNSRAADFFTNAAPGAGICRLRTEILAMTLPAPANPLTPWQLLPAASAQRTTALTTLRGTLAGLSEANQIDLFNVLRFPKASLKALDLVIDNIRTKLFGGNTLDSIMGNSTNADQLFKHLIHGPNAPNSTLPANPVTPNGIIARMVGPLWAQIGRIAPVVPTTTGSAAAGTVPSLFGIPERVPEATYIVNALPNDNGFIASATNYHTTYGLNPHNFQSLEGLLGAIHTPSNHLNRLRIVGHVGLSNNTSANLNAQFFNGGPRVISEAMLRGFGTNDEAGLRSILDDTNYLNPTAPIFVDITSELLNVMNQLHPNIMSPFGTVTRASLSGYFQQLIFAGCDLLYALRAPITVVNNSISAVNRNRIRDAMRIIFDRFRDRLNGTTVNGIPYVAAQMDALKTSIESITLVEFAFLKNTFPIFGSLNNRILTALRANAAHNTLLGKFCLGTNGPQAGSDLEKFMNICSDLLHVQLYPNADLQMDGTPLTANQRTNLTTALTTASNHVRSRLNGTIICGSNPVNNTDINNLRTAILALGLADLNLAGVGSYDTGTPIVGSNYNNAVGANQRFDILNSANGAMGRNFRRDLNQVKARFDETSWIDIRGCRIGQDPNYLEALRIFFGQTNQLPSVSGPEWWQSFSSASSIPLANEAAIDTLFGNGNNAQGQNHTAQNILDVFNRVRPLSGVDIHIAFWRSISNFSNFKFVALVWKGKLQQLPMVAPRLSDFNTLNFSDTMGRISEIFNLGASNPTNATLTRIQNKHSAIAALQTEQDTIQLLTAQASPASSDLTASHGRLLAISNDLGQAIVPANPPAGLTAAQLGVWATALVTHVDTAIIGGGTNNTEINTFRQALNAKANIALSNDPAAAGNGRADFRYYFFIGLPLLVEPLNSWFFYILNAHNNVAIRSFMNVHWQDTLPTGNVVAASTIAQQRSRQLSILTERNAAGVDIDNYVNPYPEFNRHIITRP